MCSGLYNQIYAKAKQMTNCRALSFKENYTLLQTGIFSSGHQLYFNTVNIKVIAGIFEYGDIAKNWFSGGTHTSFETVIQVVNIPTNKLPLYVEVNLRGI